MSDLPAGWREATLGEVCNKPQYGWTSSARIDGPGPLMLRTTDITHGPIDWDAVPRATEPPPRGSRFTLEHNDIVVSRAGSVGASALLDDPPVGAVFASYLMRLSPFTDLVEPKYLWLFLQSPRFWGQVVAATDGIALPNINASKLARMRVPLPPLDEQRRIVAFLEDHLAHLDAVMSHLSGVRQSANRLLATSLSRARQGVIRHLGDVADIQGGIQKQPKRKPVRNTCPFLRVANVTANGLDLSEVHEIEVFEGEVSNFGLRKDDLLVVEGNGSPSQIGRAAIWDGSIEPCVHQNHLIRVRPKPGLSPAYLEIVWNSPQNREILTAVSSSSSGLHTLSVSKLSQLSIPVPELAQQDAIVEEVTAVRASITRLLNRVTDLEQESNELRQSLLAAAFRGDLTADYRNDR